MLRHNPSHLVTRRPRAPSQTDLLLQCASAATFFTTHHGQVYASLHLGPSGHQAWPLRSALFQYWLLNRFYNEYETAPGDPSWRAALRILEARAHCYSAPPRPVHQRVAGCGHPLQTIAIDLLNAQSEVVEITAGGWNIVGDSAFSFHYHPGNLPLPRPVPAEPPALNLLRSLLNLPGPQDWLRCLAWLLAALRPSGPYPILVLQGPPGSGKSFAARVLRSLIDPAIASLCSLPFSESSLLTLAHNHWVLAFDHIVHASNRISSALCRLSTGHGFFFNERYHAIEPVPLTVQRPILLTVPTPCYWNPRPDLTDRTLTVTLPAMPPQERRSEAELCSAFEAARPSLLGALCTALSTALRRLDSVHLPAAPRFADVAAWAVAAAPAFGATDESMLTALSPSLAFGAHAHPVVEALCLLMKDRAHWTGPASQLVALPHPPDHPLWPPTPSAFSRHLKELTTQLRDRGLQVTFRRTHGGRRLITLESLPAS